MAGVVNAGILNDYSIKPKNLTQYTALRGVVDFSNIGQFDQYMTGYSFLSVIKMPAFLTMLAEKDNGVKALVDGFQHMLEYEFRGLSGLPDTTADFVEISDGSNVQRLISNVTRETSVELTSNYFERRGGLITKFMDYYLTALKDPMSKAKTYHGLIKNGLMEPGLENEVATFMYYVTDETYLRIERAYLLANVQFTKAETSMYDSEKGNIGNREIGISFNCFPITGEKVDRAAKKLLEDITGVSVTMDSAGNPTYNVKTEIGVAALDSANYTYGVMNEASAGSIEVLTDALKNEEEQR